MTNHDAKLVLSAYRSNGADARDPFFEEALEQAKRDPKLMEWFVKQRVFDEAIVSKLRTIEPPVGLNLEILAGLWSIRVPRRAGGPWLAVAAALLVAMMVLVYNGFFGSLNPDRLDKFCSDCLVQFSSTARLDMESPDLRQTQEFIRASGAPTAPAISDSLAKVPTAGCKTFRWNGQWVSLTCFELPNGESLHLFVIDKKAFGSQSIPTDFREVGQWHVEFQEENGVVMMWASRAPMNEIKAYL